MTDLLEFVGKLRHLERELREATERATARTALTVKKTIQAGAPTRLRNVGRSGARLSVGYTTKSTTAGDPYAIVQARGPWPIIESDTPAHVIPRARVRGRRRVIVIPGVGVRAYAHHPGTKGKHPWAKGVEAAIPASPGIFQTETHRALTNVF